MKIAYVITRADSVGGATVHVRDMARSMLDRGHRVQVYVGGTGPVTEQLAAVGIPFHPLEHLRRAVNPVRDLRALTELMRALQQFQPDLVSTHTAKAGWVGRAACARLGLPAIHTPHGLPFGPRMPGPRGAVFWLAEKLAAPWSRAVVCVSEAERQLALEHRLAPPDRLIVVYNGVRDISPDLAARPGTAPPRIVSVARFEPPKDHATLLEALGRLRSLDWTLDLVGDGPLQGASEGLAARLDLAGRIRFLGYRADPAPILAAAQVFVLSSRSEAMPRSVLEAMRAGLPVAATRVGGLPEAIDNEKNGVLTPRNDAAALESALGALIRDAALRERLGRAARHTYESRFRLEYTVGKTSAIYERVLNGDAGSPSKA